MRRKICLIVVLTMITSLVLTGCGDPEKKAAKEAFNEQVTRIQEQLTQRDEVCETGQALIDKSEPPLYQEDVDKLNKALDTAEKLSFEEPDVPKETEEINAETEKLKAIDYTKQINAVKKKTKNLEESIEKYKLVLNPKEDYVIKALKTVDGIGSIKAVTEDNDPNGNLHKEGGYTSQVYFAYDKVKDPYGIFSGDVIEDGTDGGGSVEVYETAENAKNREEYLANFDGSSLSSGSHLVVGSTLVRTSCELTATQQKELEKAIVDALTVLKK